MHFDLRMMVVWLLLISPLGAQSPATDKAQKFAAGDKVEVQWGRDWLAGEVVEVKPQGVLSVKTTINGRELTIFAFPKRTRLAKDTAPIARKDGAQTKPKGEGEEKRKEGAKEGQKEETEGGRKTNLLSGMRTWTDSSGEFTFEGEFVEYKEGLLKLKKATGKIANLPLERFSDADQKLVRDWLFQQANSAGASAEITPGNWSSVKTIVLTAPRRWSLSPSVVSQPKEALANRVILLSPPLGDDGFFESVQNVGFDRQRAIAFLSRVNSRPGKPTRVSLEQCDLINGRTLGAVELPDSIRPMHVDPTGRRLIVRSEEKGFGGKGRLELWDLEGIEPRRRLQWMPYEKENGHKKDVSFARFIRRDHLLTVGGGKLVLWKLPRLEAIYSLTIKDSPAVCAAGKYMAVATDQGMFVLDAMTAETLGGLAGDKGVFMKLAVSQDGMRVAMYASGRLQVWDCSQGERVRDIFLPPATRSGELLWIDSNRLLIGAQLVDVDRRVVVWRYEGLNSQGGVLAGRYWGLLGSKSKKALMPLSIPHSAARNALGGVAAADLLVIKPGARMKLEVAVPAAPNQQPQIAKTLTSRLRENGIQIVDKAELVMRAKSEKGKTRKINYRDFGFVGGSQTVQVTDQVYKLQIFEGERLIWESTRVKNAPPILLLNRGQSVEQALAEYTRPDLSFFLATPLPRLLARPGKFSGAYGSTRLSVQGALLE